MSVTEKVGKYLVPYFLECIIINWYIWNSKLGVVAHPRNLRRLRQEGHTFIVYLDYKASHCCKTTVVGLRVTKNLYNWSPRERRDSSMLIKLLARDPLRICSYFCLLLHHTYYLLLLEITMRSYHYIHPEIRKKHFPALEVVVMKSPSPSYGTLMATS